MTKLLGVSLPPDLLERLQQPDSSLVGSRVILLSTCDEDGWVRHAQLSHYEVVARNSVRLLFLTYEGSKSTGNLLREGKATFLFLDEEMSYYVRAKCSKVGSGVLVSAKGEVLFSGQVEAVIEDRLPTAKLTSGIQFSGYDPGMPAEERERVRTQLFLAEL